MGTETRTDPIEAAERCLLAAEKEDDQARMGRLIELAHAWLTVAHQRALA